MVEDLLEDKNFLLLCKSFFGDSATVKLVNVENDNFKSELVLQILVISTELFPEEANKRLAEFYELFSDYKRPSNVIIDVEYMYEGTTA